MEMCTLKMKSTEFKRIEIRLLHFSFESHCCVVVVAVAVNTTHVRASTKAFCLPNSKQKRRSVRKKNCSANNFSANERAKYTKPFLHLIELRCYSS